MGRNVNGLELTDKERAELTYERIISDFMDDGKARLDGLLSTGKITRDEYHDRLDNLRQTAENEYDLFFRRDEDDVEEYYYGDDLQERLEAF